MTTIENLYWWKDKINTVDTQNCIQFIQEYEKYYEYCQQHLYKYEDPYHMTYPTLTEFIFYGCIISKIDIAKIIYDHYSIKLQYNHLQQCLWTICKNAYFPAIEWLISENLFDRHLHSCFIDVCSNGHLELATYLYHHIKEKDDYIDYIHTLKKAHASSIKRNHMHIATWLMTL